MRRTVVMVLIGLGIIGGALAYSYETAEIKVRAKCEVKCPWPSHKGNTLLEVTTKEIVAPRWQAGSVGMQQETRMCPVCLKSKKGEERMAIVRAAEAARQAHIREERRKEAEEAKTKIPIFLGKNFKEVVAVMGEPNSSIHVLGSFSWKYENEPFGYNTTVQYVYSSPDFEWIESDKVQSANSSLIDNDSPLSSWNVATGIVPSKILKQEPNQIYAWPAYNRLTIVWFVGKRTFSLLVQGENEKVYTQTSRANPKTGEVNQIYKLAEVDWKNLRILGFSQDGPNEKFGLPALEHVERVK